MGATSDEEISESWSLSLALEVSTMGVMILLSGIGGDECGRRLGGSASGARKATRAHTSKRGKSGTRGVCASFMCHNHYLLTREIPSLIIKLPSRFSCPCDP